MTELNTPLKESELVLNNDGSVYHLELLPEDIGQTIILVGDPDRVAMVSAHFDSVILRKQKREFITHTGFLKNVKLTVISTGIGTDNIDIVLNELDALANIDLKTGTIKPTLTSLNIVRIGTSGSMQAHIDIDESVVSSHGLGLDSLMNHYKINYTESEVAYAQALSIELKIPYLHPYLVSASPILLKKFDGFKSGVTATCSGFYAPQGRQLRAAPNYPDIIDRLTHFKKDNLVITNFEMETSAIYGLARMLGHNALSINAIMANRILKKFSKHPHLTVEMTIRKALEILTN